MPKELYEDPLHPYTKALLSAIPVPDPKQKRERIVLQRRRADTDQSAVRAAVSTRCPIAIEECAEVVPELREITSGHYAACIRVEGYADAPNS